MSNEVIHRVGFVGLGHMGEPMAARLVEHGFDVTVHDLRREVTDAFVRAHGGSAVDSVRELAAGAQAVVSMLPDDDAVRTVMVGRDGVIHALRAAGVAIDMGTSSPSSTVEIARQFSERGFCYVDAPVMGGVPFARDGTLDVMAGGMPEAIQRCLPLFAALGRKTYRAGASGSGHALKAIANFVNAATFVTMLEGLVMGKKFGLEKAMLVDALEAMCTGRQHPLQKKIMPQVLTRRFGTGMAIGLIVKDVGIAASLGHDIGARSSLADETHRLWSEAAQRYGFTADQSEVVRLWEDDADIEL